MIARNLLSMLHRCCRRYAADRRGSSAVEFALLLPFMLTIYFGSTQVTDMVSADRQTALVADTVANIAAQYSSVVSNDVSGFLTAANYVMKPYNQNNLKVTVSSVLIDSSGNATVDCSATNTGAPRTGNVTSAIPSALRAANVSPCSAPGSTCTSLLWGEATYTYRPV